MSTSTGYNGGRYYSSLVKPVLIHCSYVVDATNANGLGISSLKGSLVRDVFMFTSATAGVGNSGMTNPMAHNASKGFALIKLKNNYNKYAGQFNGIVSPTTGGSLNINASALTVGSAYVINAVGAASAGTVTITPVADVSGSLASTWFKLYDGYGNTFVIWFYVTGIGGSAPVGTGGILVQQTIAQNATASAIATALDSTISLLPSGISGVSSFTASGSPVVTAVSTQANPVGPLPGAPNDGAIPTGFAFASTVFNNNVTVWQNVGLPAGLAPSVGASFIATATGFSSGGGSSGTVMLPGISGTSAMEIVGDPNQSLSLGSVGGSPNNGGFIMVQFLAPTSSSVTTLVPTAPANGSIVHMSFQVEQSSVQIAGE